MIHFRNCNIVLYAPYGPEEPFRIVSNHNILREFDRVCSSPEAPYSYEPSIMNFGLFKKRICHASLHERMASKI